MPTLKPVPVQLARAKFLIGDWSIIEEPEYLDIIGSDTVDLSGQLRPVGVALFGQVGNRISGIEVLASRCPVGQAFDHHRAGAGSQIPAMVGLDAKVLRPGGVGDAPRAAVALGPEA